MIILNIGILFPMIIVHAKHNTTLLVPRCRDVCVPLCVVSISLCVLHTCCTDINTLHWGRSNSLAVGLGATVYIWNAETGSISELHRLPFAGSYVTSLQWDARGRYLAIGTSDAEVQASGAPSTVLAGMSVVSGNGLPDDFVLI